MKRDLEHLKLLSVFYYILAALVGLGSSFGLIYVFLGIMFVTKRIPSGPPGSPGGVPPYFGWMMFGIGGSIVLVGWTLAICMISAGVCLSRRKAWMFCCIVAGCVCLNFPMGTILGIFSFLVLLRPRVKDLFAGRIYEPYDPEDDDDDDRPSRRRRPRDEDFPEDEDDPLPKPKATFPRRSDNDRYREK